MLFVVLGRLYGAEGVGVFALAQSIYLGAGILARYGMDNALMRYVGQDPTSSAVPVYLRWALIKSALLSTTAAVLVFLLRDQFALWFNAPMLSIVLPGIALAIPPFTVAFVLAGFMKGIRKPATACLLENGGIALVSSVSLFLLVEIGIMKLDYIGIVVAAAAWMILLSALLQVVRWLQLTSFNQCNAVNKKGFSRSSRAFFVLSLALFLQQVVTMLVAGILLSTYEVGLYNVSLKIGNLISFSLIVMNAVFPSRFSQLYHNNDYAGLAKLAQKGVLVGTLIVSPMLLLCFLIPEQILLLFGGEFVEAAVLLKVLAIGQAVNVCAGSVGFILSMSGHEKLVRNIVLLSSVVELIFMFILTKIYGVWGCALCKATFLVLQNFLFVYYVWNRLGFCVVPIFSKYLNKRTIAIRSAGRNS